MADDHENSSEATIRKKVDESWKDSVSREKIEDFAETTGTSVPDPSFPFFISSIGAQALAAMGELPDPSTNQKKADLVHARYLIDVIQMLSDQTKGNLTPEEESMTTDLLYELQMKFVQKSQNP